MLIPKIKSYFLLSLTSYSQLATACVALMYIPCWTWILTNKWNRTVWKFIYKYTYNCGIYYNDLNWFIFISRKSYTAFSFPSKAAFFYHLCNDSVFSQFNISRNRQLYYYFTDPDTTELETCLFLQTSCNIVLKKFAILGFIFKIKITHQSIKILEENIVIFS